MPGPEIRAFFDADTNSFSYLVWDGQTRDAAIIDPVLNLEPASGQITTTGADTILGAVAGQGLQVRWLLETHAHADHLSAAGYLKAKTGAQIAIGAGIGAVQATFRPLYAIEGRQPGEGFDRLLPEGAQVPLGRFAFEVIDTPGHTPACVSYRIADAVFVGDTLFMPDYGTARCDFPGGDAAVLYRSIGKLLALPPETRLFLCHDYLPEGRDHYVHQTTAGAQKAGNVHVHAGVTEAGFVAMRNARDATLAAPKLILPALQVNVEGGRLPPPGPGGIHRLSLPLTVPGDFTEA